MGKPFQFLNILFSSLVLGEYAVHILCDNEDIPGSPYMAQIVPKTDYDPGKVKCYGPGLEEVVQPNEETSFTIDAREAGKAPLDVLFMDDYGEVKPLWKDENGVHDPKEGGILAVKIIRAKELIKADIIGKPDPFAVIKHGAQKYSTKVYELDIRFIYKKLACSKLIYLNLIWPLSLCFG